MLKIGKIEINSRMVLAPLAGVSDIGMRRISRRFGCEFAFIEMISISALTHCNRKTFELLTNDPLDRPLGIQLLGRDTEEMLRALEIIAPYGYDVIDYNAACPVKKVARRGEGAALMQEPQELGRILRVLVEHSPVPVTVKLRAGWDVHSMNARQCAMEAEQAGVAAVFIHGRTRTQQYSGEVNYEPIRLAKEAVSVPVLGSGDVFSPELAKRMLDETGCDGVVMARGAMGNPWIFQETQALLEKGEVLPKPTVDEIRSVMKDHLDMCLEIYGVRHAHVVFRKFFMWYTKGITGIKPLRPEAVRTQSVEEMHAVIDRIPDRSAE